MTDESHGRETWLVAAWPGMGHVGAGAVAHLIDALSPALVQELPAEEFFDVAHVDVQRGIARAAPLPRSLMLEWSAAEAPRDLLLFLGEAQPSERGMRMCRRIMDLAQARGVTRVLTFAAMASQLHPAGEPRVFGAVSDPSMLAEVRERGVELLEEGQVAGLNGLLLAAAAERSVPAACLLGEMPFFAAAIRNPRASAAVLEAFVGLSGIEVDLGPLHEAARELEPMILELMERLREATGDEPGEMGLPELPSEEPESAAGAGAGAGDEDEAAARAPDAAAAGPSLSALDRERIERLFAEAARDRSAAVRLKSELDRLGAFEAYEDRFLDLFRRGE